MAIAGSAANSTEIEISGGFEIEVSPDELTVTKAGAISTRARLWMYLLYALAFCYILLSAGWSSSFIFLGVLLAAGIFRYLFVGVHNLRCTRENLEVIDVVCGQTERTWSYPRSDVKGIRFGTVSFSRYGSTGGLMFEVEGKRIKALYGLKCIEAQKILDELQRLGFDISQDVGMPMMIEMEQSRRNSWLGRLFR